MDFEPDLGENVFILDPSGNSELVGVPYNPDLHREGLLSGAIAQDLTDSDGKAWRRLVAAETPE